MDPYLLTDVSAPQNFTFKLFIRCYGNKLKDCQRDMGSTLVMDVKPHVLKCKDANTHTHFLHKLYLHTLDVFEPKTG